MTAASRPRALRSRAARALLVGTTGAVVTSTFLLAGAVPALAENQNLYQLSATGDGLYVEVDNVSLPASTQQAASFYRAQAQLTSSGNSTALAGIPYPGNFFTSLPGVVNGLAGGQFPPLPPVPGYVISTYPGTSSRHQDNGPYVIEADSGPTSSKATAGVGISANGSSTDQQASSHASTVANDDGSVLAAADAAVDGLRVGPLNLLHVGSKVTMTQVANKNPVVKASTDLGSFEVAGMKVGITNEGFVAPGTTSELPTKSVLSTVNSLLSAANIEIAVIPQVVGKDSSGRIKSFSTAGLQVTQINDVPGLGPAKLVYILGIASVSTTDVGDQSDVGPTTDDGSGGVGVSPLTPSVPDAPSDAVPGGGPTIGLENTPGGALSSGPAPVVSAVDPGSTGRGSTLGPVRRLGFVRGPALKGDFALSWYLVLVVAVAAVVGGGQLFRGGAVRLIAPARA